MFSARHVDLTQAMEYKSKTRGHSHVYVRVLDTYSMPGVGPRDGPRYVTLLINAVKNCC